MAHRTMNYAEALDQFEEIWDRAIEDQGPIRLTRDGSESVVLIAADEYDGLRTTVHLLSSPANAARLLSAVKQARRDG